MRENVATLITTIPADCKDLTVHDVTHLDALWEMASIIAGPKYELNPAEAFVLGGAILLHDAGLSVAAFPSGLDELKRTQEWQDLAAAMLRQQNLEPTSEAIQSPPPELLGQIKFALLRALHAQQAERMSSVAWSLPNGEQIYLLDDPELRQAFGAAIGRVAHSHHWDIERVAGTLLDNVGAGTVLPSEWSVSERKVACLLRCADAAHMDRRRAPTILYAATRPGGLSEIHWAAQNKINKPVVDSSTLIYSAGQPFKSSEAESWWLAYDLVRSADKEIRVSNALLEELKFAPLQVQRVFGAESPRALSNYIRPDGWRPVDAEIRVSDPVHLAQTLGGRHLYGRNVLVPFRELLQNSADAIRARRALEERPATWGRIKLTFEAVPDEPNGCWLHVDDNGIGMTERVLTGPLVDFGKSIWNSPLLHEEFPGLQSKNIHPIGKFGIGFFSVFEIARHIKVTSKHYNAGMSEAKVLEFHSLATRPLIRPAEARELPRDFSTRVSLKIADRAQMFGPYRTDLGIEPRRKAFIGGWPFRPTIPFESALLRLIVMLDVEVEYLNRVDGTSFVHTPNVYEVDAGVFLEELLPTLTKKEREEIKSAHASLMHPLEGADGSRYGRAALLLFEPREIEFASKSLRFVSVGGFVYSERGGLDLPYVGVIEGRTDEAARRFAESAVPADVIRRWATEQARLIDQTRFQKSQLLMATQRIIMAGGDPCSLPYCFTGGSLVDFATAKEAMRKNRRVLVPFFKKFSKHQIYSYSDMRTPYFDHRTKKEVFILGDNSYFLDDETFKMIEKEGQREIQFSDLGLVTGGALSVFLDALKGVWGCEPRITIKEEKLLEVELYSPPSSSWVLDLHRSA
jgi:hypothetical protein